MAEGEDLNRRRVLKTLGLTGAVSASVLSERASAKNVSGNETEGYGNDGESGSVSVFSKTDRVDLTDNPDLGERIWPIDTNASGGVCRPAAGGTKPATGKGSASWFGFGGCGTWKVFDVQPGDTYKITSRIDTCFDCVLFDDAYAIQEFVDWSWETQESYPAITATKTNARVVEYIPDGDRIRIKNLDGNGGIGFYLRVYGPDDSASSEHRIAEKFAPTFSFDADEKFFPTDPTEFEDALYEVEDEEDYQGKDDFDDLFDDIDPRNLGGYQPVVDEDVSYPLTELYGPDALVEYINSDEEYTVFYNVTDALNEDGSLYAVSYWQYYAFDQYANIHWHDWEVLHVFFVGDPIDKPEETEPLMAAASAHKGIVTNNEYAGLDREQIGILPELGAHANATDVDSPSRTGPDEEFKRAEEDDCRPSPAPADPFCQEDADPIDVTNINNAYGLPRDEKSRNAIAEIAVDSAYYEATIDGTRVQNLDIFESSEVTEEDLIKVEEGEDLQRRDNGKTLTPNEYELVPMDEVESEIDEFTGPQFDAKVADTVSDRAPLSPSLPIPGLGLTDETVDAIYSNLRGEEDFQTVGEPWKEDSFSDPRQIVSNTEFLAENNGDINSRSDEPRGEIRGGLRDTVSGTGGTLPSGRFEDETISDEVKQGIVENANVTYAPPSEEGMIVVNSEPKVGPTSNGRVLVNDLEPGEHILAVDSPNRGPYIQRIQVDEGENLAGVNGRIPLAPNQKLSKIFATTSDEQTIANLSVLEDYLGAIYDTKPLLDDKFEIFLHYKGVYTVEITTEDGEIGAYRIDPEQGESTRIESISTGKRVLAQYLMDYLHDTAKESRDLIDDESGNSGNDRGNGHGGVSNSVAVKFEAAADAAERAASTIESGRGNTAKRANNQLNTVRNQLDAVENELDAQRGKKVGEAEYLILTDRLEQAREKVNEATEAN